LEAAYWLLVVQGYAIPKSQSPCYHY
jgi:hypothetical protein